MERLPDDRRQPKRLTGIVERLIRAFEGLAKIEGVPGVSLHFRVDDETASRLAIGAHVTFGVAWRMAGLSAVDLKPAS